MKRIARHIFMIATVISGFCKAANAATRRYSSSSSNTGNDVFWWFIGIMAALFVFAVVGEIISLGNKMSSTEREFAEEAHKLSNKGLDAKTSRKAEEALLQYETAHTIAKSATNLVSEHIYQDDMNELRDHYETLVKEEWEARAGKLLDKFYDLYIRITEPTFSDVETAYRSKKRCIEYWQKYYSTLPEGVYVYPKQYIKDYFGEEYDPCWESHEQLEKKLTACIEQMKPEYKRAVKLRKDLLDIVAQNESMLRSELLNKSFDGCTKKEIEWCYRELAKQYRLVEIKMNNRYIVKLSDKEREKRNKENPPR